MVGESGPVRAVIDAADRPDSAVPEILVGRHPVRLADDLRRGQSGSGRRRRPAWLVAEPLPVVQIARRLRSADQSLLRRGIQAFCDHHRIAAGIASDAFRADLAVAAVRFFRSAGLRSGLHDHDAGHGPDPSGESRQCAIPRARPLWARGRCAGLGYRDRASRPDGRHHGLGQPADGRACLCGGAACHLAFHPALRPQAAISVYRPCARGNLLALERRAIRRRVSVRRDEFRRSRTDLSVGSLHRHLRL